MQRQRVAAYGVASRRGADGDEVLLVHASDRSKLAGSWFLPGGGVEWGEQPVDAVGREFGEETGLTVAVGRLLTVSSAVDRFADEDLQTIRISYAVEVTGGVLAAEEGGTSELPRWVPLAELASLPVMPYALEALTAASVPPAG